MARPSESNLISIKLSQANEPCKLSGQGCQASKVRKSNLDKGNQHFKTCITIRFFNFFMCSFQKNSRMSKVASLFFSSSSSFCYSKSSSHTKQVWQSFSLLSVHVGDSQMFPPPVSEEKKSFSSSSSSSSSSFSSPLCASWREVQWGLIQTRQTHFIQKHPHSFTPFS